MKTTYTRIYNETLYKIKSISKERLLTSAQVIKLIVDKSKEWKIVKNIKGE